MHTAWAVTLLARHSHPIPASPLGETEAWRNPTRAEQLLKTDPRYSLSAPLQNPPLLQSLPSASATATSPLLPRLFLSALCKERV